MVTATYHTTFFGPYTVQVDGLINPGEWFGRTMLFSLRDRWYVVEADCLQDAIDTIVDSEYGLCLTISEETAEEREAEGDEVYRAGNFGEPVDLDGLFFPGNGRCTVNYCGKGSMTR